MEKRTPHCKLAAVKAMVSAGRVRATVSALAGGAALGFSFEEIVGIVADLTLKDFYKSMTTQRTTGSGRTCTGRRLRPGRYISNLG